MGTPYLGFSITVFLLCMCVGVSGLRNSNDAQLVTSLFLAVHAVSHIFSFHYFHHLTQLKTFCNITQLEQSSRLSYIYCSFLLQLSFSMHSKQIGETWCHKLGAALILVVLNGLGSTAQSPAKLIHCKHPFSILYDCYLCDNSNFNLFF